VEQPEGVGGETEAEQRIAPVVDADVAQADEELAVDRLVRM
jgi:hypothetical protein